MLPIHIFFFSFFRLCRISRLLVWLRAVYWAGIARIEGIEAGSGDHEHVVRIYQASWAMVS